MHEMGTVPQLAVWDGLQALALSRREQLLVWLAHQAKADGYTPLVVSQVLGISLSYLHQLYTGERHIATAGQRVYAELAGYLGQTPIVVRCAAGDIRLEDFFTSDSLAKGARSVCERLPAVQADLVSTPLSVQAFAGIMAGLVIPPRRELRDLAAHGPAALPQH